MSENGEDESREFFSTSTGNADKAALLLSREEQMQDLRFLLVILRALPALQAFLVLPSCAVCMTRVWLHFVGK